MKKIFERFFMAPAVLGFLFLVTHCGSSKDGSTAVDASSNSVSAGGTTSSQGGAVAPKAGNGSVTTGSGGSTSQATSPSKGGAGGQTAASNAGKTGSTLDAGVKPKDSGTNSPSDAAAPKADATSATGTFPAVTDLTGNGPFKTKDASCGNAYTCYYPTELGKGGVKHPFVVWGDGAGTPPTDYTLLPHLASHGFVVIASNNTNVTPQDLTGGLDWAFAENDRSGSEFYQKLDTSNVASMGFSMGGLGTSQIAGDKRLKTTVHISGGSGGAYMANLKNPAAFFCGNSTDIAAANCDSDFQAATTPVFYGNFDCHHGGVVTPPYSDYIAAAVTGWLRWQLMADTTLKTMFVGSNCTLCKDPNWKVQQKGLN